MMAIVPAVKALNTLNKDHSNGPEICMEARATSLYWPVSNRSVKKTTVITRPCKITGTTRFQTSRKSGLFTEPPGGGQPNPGKLDYGPDLY
jgi:hypothetical protein